jgi:hypothetical protein
MKRSTYELAYRNGDPSFNAVMARLGHPATQHDGAIDRVLRLCERRDRRLARKARRYGGSQEAFRPVVYWAF